MNVLTEMKKADREKMAARIEGLCLEHGAAVNRVDPDLLDPREIALDIVLDQARVRIDFDGSKGMYEDRDVFCMPWNTLTRSDARMSEAFGRAVGAEVNPHHRAKCTGFAYGFDDLVERLGSAFTCINEGNAFASPAARAA